MKLLYCETHWELFPILITAKHSGLELQLERHETAGEEVTPGKFIWKRPKYVEEDGLVLHGHETIMCYIASNDLQGSGIRPKTLIQMWFHFINKEILPLLYAWVYPILGILPYNKQRTEDAKTRFQKVLSILDSSLRTRTYLVGERMTLADISVASALLWPFVLVFEPSYREPYVSLNRWFTTCINSPVFTAAVGKTPLCKEAHRYKEGEAVKIVVPFENAEE
ncbi:elongation factor 1-gamma-like isoform 2-T2 [Discoglossus pictus]